MRVFHDGHGISGAQFREFYRLAVGQTDRAILGQRQAPEHLVVQADLELLGWRVGSFHRACESHDTASVDPADQPIVLDHNLVVLAQIGQSERSALLIGCLAIQGHLTLDVGRPLEHRGIGQPHGQLRWQPQGFEDPFHLDQSLGFQGFRAPPVFLRPVLDVHPVTGAQIRQGDAVAVQQHIDGRGDENIDGILGGLIGCDRDGPRGGANQIKNPLHFNGFGTENQEASGDQAAVGRQDRGDFDLVSERQLFGRQQFSVIQDDRIAILVDRELFDNARTRFELDPPIRQIVQQKRAPNGLGLGHVGLIRWSS